MKCNSNLVRDAEWLQDEQLWAFMLFYKPGCQFLRAVLTSDESHVSRQCLSRRFARPCKPAHLRGHADPMSREARLLWSMCQHTGAKCAVGAVG